MSNRASDTSGQKSDVGNRSSIGTTNSSQRPQSTTKPGTTNTATSPANHTSTAAAAAPVVKAPKPTTTFAAAAGGKATNHVPTRTNSAPPEKSSHFQPQKTSGVLPTTEPHVSYRSALGVKAEPSPEQKPKAGNTTTQEPAKATEPESATKAPVVGQPEVTSATEQTSPGTVPVHENAGANPTGENAERSPPYNRDGGDNNYRNRNSNPRRNMQRSDSYGGSGSMNNNRPPRSQPSQQQQQQQQINTQSQAQQQQQYYMQQQQALAHQQQQQQAAVFQAILQYNPQQFQQYISSWLPPEYVAYYMNNYAAVQAQAGQALAYQQQIYYQQMAAAGRSQYPAAAAYYQPQAMAQGYPVYGYQQTAAGAVPIMQVVPGQTVAYPTAPKLQVEDQTMMSNPSLASTGSNPVYQSSPVVNTTPAVVTGTPSSQTPVISKVEPEVPPPALYMPPQHQEEEKEKVVEPAPVVVPPKPVVVEPPKPERRQLKISSKTGETFKVGENWGKAAVTTATPATSTAPSQTEVPASSAENKDPSVSEDKTAAAVSGDKSAVEETPIPQQEPAPVVEETVNSIPDLPVSVARPKKARAPTLSSDETPVNNDQPSFPVEKPTANRPNEETNTSAPSIAPPGLKKDENNENWDENRATSQNDSFNRRLVAGNKLSHTHYSQPASKRVYTKAEIMALKPDAEGFAKNLMGNINFVSDGQGGGKGGGGQSGSFNRSGGGSRGGGRSGGGEYGRGDGTPTSTEAPGWSRETLPPIQTGSKKGKGGPASPVPPPKKKETDPIEVMAQAATLILNQIVPKTFDLFCQQLLELPLKNTAMLDRLVELIFEKAIHDTAFVEMIARLCLELKEKSNWTFFTIVKREEEFFWVRDFSFPDEAAGPYYSRADVFAAFNNEEEIPAMKPSTISPSNIKHTEIVLLNNHFLKIVQKEGGGEWYVTWVPEDQVPIDQRAQVLYATEKEAVKDATTELSFRGRLAHSCEIEFQRSVKDESLFEAIDEEYRQLKLKRPTLALEQYELQEADILDRRSKIKRRMLANIRFVGELYKKKLLNTETMHDCVTELLGHPPNWKQTYEDEDLELLCDLLSTVGETLESKTKKMKGKIDYQKRFEQYFDKLKALSKDKSLLARIRFRIEGVIDLRNNGWVKRAGGVVAASAEPQKEENRPGSQRVGPMSSSSGPGVGSGAPSRILTRESSGGYAGGPGGRPSSQREPYGDRQDARARAGDVREQDRYNSNNAGGGGGSGRYGGGGYDDRDRDYKGGSRGPGNAGSDDRRSSNYRNNEPPMSKPSSSGGGSGKPSSTSGGGGGVPPSSSDDSFEKSVADMKFNQEHLRRAVVVSVDEILSGVEIGELRAMLKESSVVHTGYFVQVMLEKYANTSSNSQREKLLAIFDDAEIAAWLVSNRLVIEKAVENFESLEQLADVTVDIVQAPESFATVLNRLVKLNVLQVDRITRMVEKWKQLQADLFPEEELDAIFNRFLSKLH